MPSAGCAGPITTGSPKPVTGCGTPCIMRLSACAATAVSVSRAHEINSRKPELRDMESVLSKTVEAGRGGIAPKWCGTPSADVVHHKACAFGCETVNAKALLTINWGFRHGG